MQDQAFLIFSGHNDRAVLALCRFFSQYQLPFFIVTSGTEDYIFKTPWAEKIIYIREDKNVNISLFEKICYAAPSIKKLIYCPTTEYINQFILINRSSLECDKLDFPLPNAEIYQCLSNKSSSLEIVKTICNLQPPPFIPWKEVVTPCVFKPKKNISNGAVHYPILCFNEIDAYKNYAELNQEEWFVQKYIQGQSHYLCAYLSRSGNYASYWQTNWVQQPGGKSIVLAKTGKNPGIDESEFFHQLWKKNYHGPIMMEIIEDKNGNLFYIEINPRFWGPLQLAVDACPRLLELFCADAGFILPIQFRPHLPEQDIWYAWAAGARIPGCHVYPAAQHMTDTEMQSLLTQFDVFDSNRNWN